MESIKIFIEFISNNWTFIITLLSCLYLGYIRLKKWNSLSEQEKINIALKVVGTRENGYHDLDMIMVPIGLYDVIDIEGQGNTLYGMSNKRIASEIYSGNISCKLVNL